MPDLNTVSYLELRQVVQNIRGAIQIPMVVDIDTGFGAPLNLYRLTREFEMLDIAAVQIEDQKAPKKCGHELGRRLVDDDEMIRRIRTIYENRPENGMVIIARTDARTVAGLDEAIRRGRLYAQAGADVIFVESPESLEEVRRIAREIDAPVLFNNVEGGRSPFLSRQELEDAGVRLAIYPNAQTRVVTKSAWSFCPLCRKPERPAEWRIKCCPTQSSGQCLTTTAGWPLRTNIWHLRGPVRRTAEGGAVCTQRYKQPRVRFPLTSWKTY